MGMKNIAFFAFACLMAAVTSPAVAQGKTAQDETNVIDVFDTWTAFSEVEGGKKLCFMGGVPVKEEGKYKTRGDTYVLITHRPAEKRLNEVSIKAGYTHKEHSEVTVVIGGSKFQLFTDNGFSWAKDAKADASLVRAMKSGKNMIVKGTSSRGTVTTDTYSLKNFTAAHKAIGAACGVK